MFLFSRAHKSVTIIVKHMICHNCDSNYCFPSNDIRLFLKKGCHAKNMASFSLSPVLVSSLFSSCSNFSSGLYKKYSQYHPSFSPSRYSIYESICLLSVSLSSRTSLLFYLNNITNRIKVALKKERSGKFEATEKLTVFQLS